jgi:hypothetical protein
MVCHMLVEMHVHYLVWKDVLFNPRDILDECNICAKRHLAHIISYLHTLNKPAVYMLSVQLCLK